MIDNIDNLLIKIELAKNKKQTETQVSIDVLERLIKEYFSEKKRADNNYDVAIFFENEMNLRDAGIV